MLSNQLQDASTSHASVRYVRSYHSTIALQEEVRDFASGVVLDALKIAVNFHGGAHDPTGVCFYFDTCLVGC